MNICAWCELEKGDWCPKCGRPISEQAKAAVANLRKQAEEKGLSL